MPLYEYQCRICDSRFERLEPASASATHSCPGCGAEARRLLGVPALQFKGSGWYVTDYGKAAAATAARSGDDGVAAGSEATACRSSAA